MARAPLPVDVVLPSLIAAVRSGGAAVLVAPPGAGKTTRVPPALLAAGLAGPGDPGSRIVVLEPRRVAARAAARRMAEEGGWRLGEEVGYQVRFDRRAGPATRILVVTEGLLVQMLQADPFLTGVGAVVFDELHERSLAADLSLAMVRRVRREVRPDLAVVAMSATLDPGPVAAFLGGCPVIESAGRLHPVEVVHLEEAAARGGERPLASRVAAAVSRALAASPGDVLVFLPGRGEIARAAEALAGVTGGAQRDGLAGIAVMPLHGELPAERQDEALRPLGRRKVVLATNVAETSVTVEGVTAVVDSGLVRRLRFDPATGLDRLELGRISRASADQRAGRAGRQGPGLCLRLWPAWEHAALPERETPEVARVDLAAPALQLLSWGERDLAAFEWFEAPDPAALASALELLARLGALEAIPVISEVAGNTGRGGTGTTAVGRQMARLPLHPRLARLLVEGHARGVVGEAALLAATLAERDPVRRPGPGEARSALHPSRSDLLDRLEALEAFEAGSRSEQPPELAAGRLDPGAARFVLRARDQLADLARRELGTAGPPPAGGGSREGREEALLRSLLVAYPDRLARRRAPGSPRALMVGGRGVRLADESAVLEPELFLCVEVAESVARPAARPAGRPAGRTAGGQAGGRSGAPPGDGGEALVRLASAVEPGWLDPGRLATRIAVEFDEERERVVAWKRTRWEDLVLAETEVPLPSGHRGLRETRGHRASPETSETLETSAALETPGTPGTPADAERVLAEAAAARLDRALPLADPEVAAWLARVRSLATWMPELGLPRFGEEELAALLPALAAGRRSFAELRRAPLLAVLEGSLTPAQREALRREAPERLEAPSGSRIRLAYEEGRPPVLAARIQELFGLAETPRVAAGRVPVLLHLLAPNGRPQQVTHDLRSFWERTYPQVKKELQGRYPRHAWPADPWNATPERRPKRRP